MEPRVGDGARFGGDEKGDEGEDQEVRLQGPHPVQGLGILVGFGLIEGKVLLQGEFLDRVDRPPLLVRGAEDGGHFVAAFQHGFQAGLPKACCPLTMIRMVLP